MDGLWKETTCSTASQHQQQRRKRSGWRTSSESSSHLALTEVLICMRSVLTQIGLKPRNTAKVHKAPKFSFCSLKICRGMFVLYCCSILIDLFKIHCHLFLKFSSWIYWLLILIIVNIKHKIQKMHSLNLNLKLKLKHKKIFIIWNKKYKFIYIICI